MGEEGDDRPLSKLETFADERGPSADWSAQVSSTSHIFVVANGASSSQCQLNMFNNCRGASGRMMRCTSCRIVVHEACIHSLPEETRCRKTFVESLRKYRQETRILHHFVPRHQIKGKCHCCHKTIGSSGRSCSWCKMSYCSKDSCQKALVVDLSCDLGPLSRIIVPPHWIVRVPRRQSFDCSLESAIKNDKIGNSKSARPRNFCIKSVPDNKLRPLLVFLNPKSGGNQGAKLMEKFQTLLNPRQVFDLTQGGPKPAIELFRKVPNVRLLACGGDGTVGWLLSVLDQVAMDQEPAVGVLPLGTGNDLARSLGWGGGYMDEPISKILTSLDGASEVLMDRWHLEVRRLTEFEASDKRGKDSLPLDVVNNYFSLGVDAQIALNFHEAREAAPHKFNSRIRNKMFYGRAGGKDLFVRKWRNLSDNIEVICDDKDVTEKLRQHKVHSVLFANIPSFGSGTRPWNNAYGKQRIDDGLIEVIGLTTYQLPMLQAGVTGTCITQCRKAVVRTKKTIPMQVDGEAIRLNPAEIELTFLNQVRMLAKKRNSGSAPRSAFDAGRMRSITIKSVSLDEYKTWSLSEMLEKARIKGQIEASSEADLERVRGLIDALIGHDDKGDKGKMEWCYVDCITAFRPFRLDRGQERLHFVTDVMADDDVVVIVMDEDVAKVNDVIIKTDNKKDMNNNVIQNSTAPRLVSMPDLELEKTTEGVLKAARIGDVETLENLDKQGYSLLAIDETGKTALHYAARFGHQQIVKYLLAQAPGSMLDMQDNEKGHTALHKAASYDRKTICCLLVAAGASLDAVDHTGKTALQLSVDNNHNELAEYLESQIEFRKANKEN